MVTMGSALTFLKPKVKNGTSYGLVDLTDTQWTMLVHKTFFVTKVVTPLEGIIHPEMKIPSSFTHTYAVPNP